ncbi:uncharacterized protein LOC115210852 [Argonauta hians]
MASNGLISSLKNTRCYFLFILIHVFFIIPSNCQNRCDRAGKYICHPNNPNKFQICIAKGMAVTISCPAGLHFDPTSNNCNWPNEQDCTTNRENPATTKPVSDKYSTTPLKIPHTSPTPRMATDKTPTGPCTPMNCKLPNCKCPGSGIPYSLPTSSIPQIVLLTFDDGVHSNNFLFYSDLFNSTIRNPNGCHIKGTFFVSGDYVQYNRVSQLYEMGNEIASHTQTHKYPIDYWLNGNYQTFVREFVGMKKWLNEKANIPLKEIRGMRSPFLALGGNAQFDVLRDFGFSYDSSMVTGAVFRNNEAPAWPFTLDYPVSSKYCRLRKCPTKSYPGIWEVPLIRWYNEKGSSCAMPDACNIPKDEKSVLEFLKSNFNRHYQSNKAPFGIYLHSPWLMKHANAMKTFLEDITKKNDVWLVSMHQALEWIRNPVLLKDIFQFKSWGCK